MQNQENSNIIMFKEPIENQKLFQVIKEGEIISLKKKQYWSHDEDSLLLNLIETEIQKGNKIKWLEIALNFDKDYKQCYSRYRHINPGLNKGYWSKEEEEKLIELVNINGKKWATISKIIGTRSGKQIRLHYTNITDSRVNKLSFSEEEHNRLIDLHKKHGSNWRVISTFFNGRTPDNLKCKFNNYTKKLRVTNKRNSDLTSEIKKNLEDKEESDTNENISDLNFNSDPSLTSFFIEKAKTKATTYNIPKPNDHYGRYPMDFDFLPQQVNIALSTYNSMYNKKIYDSIFNVNNNNKLFNDFNSMDENYLMNYNICALNDLQNERSIIEKNFDFPQDSLDKN